MKTPAAVTVALLCFALSGCGACDAFDPVDQGAPDIPLETMDGTPVKLSSYRGRDVVVHFWLPSCHVCKREFPGFLEAAREEADADTVVLTVSIDPDLENIRSAAARLGVEVPVLVASGEVLGPMHVGAAPSTVYLDRLGVIRAAVNGPKDRAFHTRRFRALKGG